MLENEINKFNLIKKTKFLPKKINLTKTGKKKSEATLVILKRRQFHGKRIKRMLEDEIVKKKSLKKEKKN
jgi:hypothetical protein